jgi:UDP-glucuronate decarboxylase
MSQKKHIFITGGTGFFGKALLKHWVSNDNPELGEAKFTILSRNPDDFKSAYGSLLSGLDVRLVAGDILESQTLPEEDYSYILHAATDSTKGLKLAPLERSEQIIDGTRNVLDLALRCDMPRVLMVSSGAVYGNISHFPNGVPEDYCGMPNPLNPENAYGVAKRHAEHLCALYKCEYGLESVIARCFAFVGEDLPLNEHFAIGNFIRDAFGGNDIIIKGDGTPVRTYLDQRDLAKWLTDIMLYGVSGSAYNVGSNEKITLAELARIVSEISDTSSDIQILGKPPEGQTASRNVYVPSIDRAQKKLGLKVRFSLSEAIEHMFKVSYHK